MSTSKCIFSYLVKYGIESKKKMSAYRKID